MFRAGERHHLGLMNLICLGRAIGLEPILTESKVCGFIVGEKGRWDGAVQMKRSYCEWLTLAALSGSRIKPPALPEVLTETHFAWSDTHIVRDMVMFFFGAQFLGELDASTFFPSQEQLFGFYLMLLQRTEGLLSAT